MTGAEPPETPEIEQAYRAAYRALAALVPGSVTAEEESSLQQVFSQFKFLLDRADLVTTSQLGPQVSWQAPPPDDDVDLDLMISGVDLDDGVYDFGDVQLSEEALTGPRRTWHDSALSRAALVYKRTCGWDFAPGESGVWLVMLAPDSASGGDGPGPWFYGGRLTGFVVVYDRDEDGVYESVGHIWTATAWQRRGIARRLLTEARAQFPISTVEEPYTRAGAAFLKSCPDPDDPV
ncbi:GNAT family N-acetyltransferase (plasmid) [Saccharothrix sp. AJ9571]|nr:GNAT family N-acetyltransferase [Saccharothrix sp. AJ9571]